MTTKRLHKDIKFVFSSQLMFNRMSSMKGNCFIKLKIAMAQWIYICIAFVKMTFYFRSFEFTEKL